MTRHLFADPTELATGVARRFREAAEEAIAARGRFACALTGGSAARLIYGRLADEPIAWERVHLFWGDERAVAPDHADSNHRLAHDVLLSKIRIPEGNVHRMRGEQPDLGAAAAAYEQELLGVVGADGALDLVHLGVGPDGHVCSLFAGHPLLDERARRVAPIEDSPKPPPRRLTLTLRALHEARALWLLVAGDDKADAVRSAISDPASTLPAALAARGPAPATWMLDRAAASKLP